MVSISNLEQLLCILSLGMIGVSLATKVYVKKPTIELGDLFFVFLALSCFLHQAIIVETILFIALAIPAFMEICKYQAGKKIKTIGFLNIAINACALFYIQTQAKSGTDTVFAILWMTLTLIFNFPLFHLLQQQEKRIRNSNFFHFAFRTLIIGLIYRYLEKTQVDVVWIYGILSVSILLLLSVWIYSKTSISKMVVQNHVSLLIISLSFVFPHDLQGILLMATFFIYMMDNDGVATLTHNRRWIEMLEWPTWQSPIFVLLILSVQGVRSESLALKIIFVIYVFLLGMVSMFGPHKINIEETGVKNRNIILAKSVVIVSVILIVESLL
jgi:hypothetical protein